MTDRLSVETRLLWSAARPKRQLNDASTGSGQMDGVSARSPARPRGVISRPANIAPPWRLDGSQPPTTNTTTRMYIRTIQLVESSQKTDGTQLLFDASPRPRSSRRPSMTTADALLLTSPSHYPITQRLQSPRLHCLSTVLLSNDLTMTLKSPEWHSGHSRRSPGEPA